MVAPLLARQLAQAAAKQAAKQAVKRLGKRELRQRLSRDESGRIRGVPPQIDSVGDLPL